jgi:hypothetical protein
MLPSSFDPTGSYSLRQFDRARGYRLLAHAEIEACLEDLAIGHLNDAFDAWMVDRRPRTCLIALLAYHEGNLGEIPTTISGTGTSATPLRSRMRDARDQYIRWVRTQNHGIREANILRLLLPVGIMESDLDQAWLQQIDAFGSARGDTAHQALRTQQPPDPSNEYQTVRGIVAGMRKVDRLLSKSAS